MSAKEDLQRQLDDVRSEQRSLWQLARSTGLTSKAHQRTADLGRRELQLMNDLRDLGRRRAGPLSTASQFVKQ